MNPLQRPPTAIVMLNLGGPETLDAVRPFLMRLFADHEIMPLPFQRWLGPFIAERRTPKVRERYAAIGGGSPILHWTRLQGQGMADWLDRISPETAPHRFYVAFRYTPPFAEDALRQMAADGVRRAVAFTQYPQFSCTTTGSSLNELWRAAEREGLEDAFHWSVIDRWPLHPGFLQSLAESIRAGLESFPAEERGQTMLLFSAHSLPMSVVKRGDAYPPEIEATVQAVMGLVGRQQPYRICYQSSVGPVPWLGPSTDDTIRELGKHGQRNVLVVPVAFTSDHIETLHEIDIEYGELAHAVGIRNFKRAPAFNGSPTFQRALAEVVAAHLRSGETCSAQYGQRCKGCSNPYCQTILQPATGLPQVAPQEEVQEEATYAGLD
ncbi:MAG: ferrochelatase [Anaerolineaceae bacterium]|nr:ferrochelatase [Anaerolineaceae bacterium]